LLRFARNDGVCYSKLNTTRLIDDNASAIIEL
jgi:hypothetical protein